MTAINVQTPTTAAPLTEHGHGHGHENGHENGHEQPSVARMWDYYMGGNYSRSVDREAAANVAKAMPDCFNLAQENRSFYRRAIRYMTAQGITQFIDIGSGLPTVDNTHQVAQSLNPEAKVLYVDMDPVVLELGQEIFASNSSVSVICADIRQPQMVLNHPEFTRLIDVTKPIGVLMMSVACFFNDTEISSITSQIRAVMCEGSYLAATHDTMDGQLGQTENVNRVKEIYDFTPIPLYVRNRGEVSLLFEGLELVSPGVVMVDEWHPELDSAVPSVRWLYCGMGRKTTVDKSSGTNLEQ